MSAKPEPQIAEALQEISNRASALVSDEIALAKAEISQKVSGLGRGAAAAGAAGFFLFFALILGAHALAWGIYELLGGYAWLSYLIAAAIFIVLGALAGLIAMKLFKKSSPPVPTQAIAEAQATKQAITDARRTA